MCLACASVFADCGISKFQTQSDTRNIAAASHDAVITVYDAAGNVIETHEHKGDFKEW